MWDAASTVGGHQRALPVLVGPHSASPVLPRPLQLVMLIGQKKGLLREVGKVLLVTTNVPSSPFDPLHTPTPQLSPDFTISCFH